MLESDIETFLAIARYQTFKAAASRLNVSQSAVSKRLRQLEEEFQVTLFERGKGIKKVVLTRPGENFIDIAERLLGLLQEARKLNVQPNARRLAISSIASVNAVLMPFLYTRLTNHKPPIHVTIVTLHPAQMYDEMDLRHIDVGYCPLYQIHPSVSATPCFSEPFVGMALADAPMFARDVIPLTELDPAENLYGTWTTEFRVWYSQFFPVNVAKMHMDDPHMIFKVMQNKKQWTIVPLSVARYFYNRERYRLFHLDPPPPERIIYKLRHKLPLKGTANLLRIVDTYIKEMYRKLLEPEFHGQRGTFFSDAAPKKQRGR